VRALLDTHTFLWWLDGDRLLSKPAFDCITDRSSEVLVSAATAWEIATKHRIGKLPEAADVARDVAGCIQSQGFLTLSVTVVHGQRAGALPGHHRDPFDRMLIAQAILEDCALVSNDVVFDRYGVVRLW
jgi:PIN domain nuclease of toxin-antitoxin system